jgi:hypothetical protein
MLSGQLLENILHLLRNLVIGGPGYVSKRKVTGLEGPLSQGILKTPLALGLLVPLYGISSRTQSLRAKSFHLGTGYGPQKKHFRGSYPCTL